VSEPIVRSVAGDRVVTVTLDSPANRNALSRRLVAELSDALTAAVGADAGGDGDGEAGGAGVGAVHAVLLTHTGTTFCSGAALDEMRAGDPSEGTRDLLALFRRLLTVPVPVVARVDGATRAGGLGVLGACDIVLASARSTFAFTEVRLGLAPAVISLPLRPLLTARAASRYFLTGETFGAAAAAEIGLVTAAGDDVDTLTEAVLDGLRRADPQGLRETKPLVTGDRLRAIDDEGAAMGQLSARLFGSPVAQSHFAAFFDQTPRKGQR
jgi:enoyl-CoA hydratase